jgi:hypothetical protein
LCAYPALTRSFSTYATPGAAHAVRAAFHLSAGVRAVSFSVSARNGHFPTDAFNGGVGDVFVRPFGLDRQLHFDLLGNGQHTTHATRGMFGCAFFVIAFDMAGQCHHALFHRHANMRGVNRWFLQKFGQHGLLQLAILNHGCCLASLGKNVFWGAGSRKAEGSRGEGQ